METSIHRLKQRFRDFGLDESIFRLLAKFRVVQDARTLDIYFQELNVGKFNANPPKKDAKGSEFIIREISSKELAGFSMGVGMTGPEIFEEKFRLGSKLFGLIRENKLVATKWCDDRIADLDFIGRPRQVVHKGHVYLHGLHLMPALRGMGLGSYFQQWMLQQMAQKGYAYAFLACFLNRRVETWQEKNGFRRWGRVFYFCFMGRRKTWVRRTEAGKNVMMNFLADQ